MDLLSDLNTNNRNNTDDELNTIEFSEIEDYRDMDGGNRNTYADIQERGNRRAESLSNDVPADYNVDYMDSDTGSKRQRGIDTDLHRQYGGANDNLNYLDQYSNGQYSSQKLDTYEKEFFDIYRKAREYQKRAMDLQNRMNQSGGQDAEKKRPVNKTLLLMLEISKTLKQSGKYPDIPQKHLMKISKRILDQAKTDTGSTEVNDDVRRVSLDLAKNADFFVSQYRKEMENSSGTDSNTNQRSRSNRSNSRDTADFSSGFEHRLESNRNSNSRSGLGSESNSKPWSGIDSNYRSYAQSSLWNEQPSTQARRINSALYY